MSALACSISGSPPQHPVVSKTTGRLFEKALILKYIEEHSKCPVTGAPMAADDLIDLVSNAASKPRPVDATSIPALLSLMQNEWDAFVLESFELKKHLHQTRQELSHALYQYDAACRVIARVTKERDDALALVQGAESRFRSSAAVGSSSNMDVDSGSSFPGISMEIKTKISEIGVELLQQRKKKVVPEGLAAPEALASFKAGKGVAADKEKSPMVCLSIGAAGLTVGSESGTVSTFNPSTGAFTSSIKQAHDGHVTCIAQSPIGVVSGGQDGCVKLWAAGSCKHTFRDLAGAIVGVSVHPCGDYAAAAGESGCWAFYDLAYGTCRQVFAQNAALSTGVFHPDGLIFATAEKNDSLQLWDLKSERPALKFSAGSGHITSVAFSENGYSIAAACGGTASIFDLRKLAKSQGAGGAVATLSSSAVKFVTFDSSGSYVASAGDNISIFNSKSYESVAQYAAKDVTGIAFTPLAQSLAAIDRKGIVTLYK